MSEPPRPEPPPGELDPTRAPPRGVGGSSPNDDLGEPRSGPSWRQGSSSDLAPLGLESGPTPRPGSAAPRPSPGPLPTWDLSPAPESEPGFRLSEAETDEGIPLARLAPAPRSLSRAEILRLLATRFEVLGELGAGGMGIVWRARDEAGREVALKVAQGERLTARSLERFRREGQVTARLRHPGILRVHAAGEIEGMPYLAYELVPECRSADEVADELDLRGRVELLREVGRALGYAHAAGVVHRDVKPDNILVDPSGRPKVADFGLALMAGESRLTQTGAMVGTPYYMAPETFAGDRGLVGPPADVWALGVMLYRTLTGTYPFDGGSLRELELRVIQAEPTPVRELEPSVDPELAAICHHALEVDPVERYVDGNALADDLEAWLTGGEISASEHSGLQRAWRRHRSKLPLLGLLAAGLALLGAALGHALRPAAPTPDTQAPELSLATPPAFTYAEELTLRGRVVDAGPWVEVEVLGSGRPPLRVVSGADFELTIPLRVGPNRLRVRARDAAGNEAPPLVRELERGRAPAWYRRLPPERRAPLPLPAGLVFAELPGEYRWERDGSILTWVPPGTFAMGLAPGRLPRSNPDEGPVHEVTLTRGLFLGKLELSRAQYLRFCREAGHRQPPPLQHELDEPEQHPISQVTYEDALAYCAWAGLRLPSEAEWEWAARGPSGQLFPWGDEPPRGSGQCNRQSGDPYPATSPGGSFPRDASPFGNLDLAGNVWEFVADRYGPYSAEPARDPLRREGELVVQRGGSWSSLPETVRATCRTAVQPTYTNTSSGFRVALSPGE